MLCHVPWRRFCSVPAAASPPVAWTLHFVTGITVFTHPFQLEHRICCGNKGRPLFDACQSNGWSRWSGNIKQMAVNLRCCSYKRGRPSTQSPVINWNTREWVIWPAELWMTTRYLWLCFTFLPPRPPLCSPFHSSPPLPLYPLTDSISLGLCKQLNWVSRIRGWLAQHWNNKQIPGDIIGVVSVCRWHESKLEIYLGSV